MLQLILIRREILLPDAVIDDHLPDRARQRPRQRRHASATRRRLFSGGGGEEGVDRLRFIVGHLLSRNGRAQRDEPTLSSRVYSRGILPEASGARFLASTLGMTVL